MTVELLSKCMPHAAQANVIRAAVPLTDAMAHYQINTKERQAAFLAQLAHESASLLAMTENLNYRAADLLRVFKKYFTTEQAAVYERKPEKIANRVYANRYGNGDEASGDGWLHRGAGYIQLTFKDNHEAAAKEFGKSVAEIGDWLRTHSGASWSAAWFWSKSGLNTIADKNDLWRGDRGAFKGLSQFEYISVVINGALTGIIDRKQHWTVTKKALGI